MTTARKVLAGLFIVAIGGLTFVVYGNREKIDFEGHIGVTAANGLESAFKTACRSHGNVRSACNCAWDEAERLFQGANMDLLIANVSGNSAKSRQIMGSGAINGFQFGANARKFTDRSQARCDAYF